MMIVTAWEHALFDVLDAGARWQVIENYRSAKPGSETGRYRAVDDLLEHLCTQVHAAMWVPGFDAQAWAMLHHDTGPTCQKGLEGSRHVVEAAALAQLSALTLQAGWWPVFDHREPDPFTLGRALTADQASAHYGAQAGCQACAGPAATPAPGAPASGAPRPLTIDVRDGAGHAGRSAVVRP